VRYRRSDSHVNHHRDDEQPSYCFASLPNSAEYGLPGGRSRATKPPRQAQGGLCNICNEPCESDEVLRKHYRVAHPALAAKFEAKSNSPSDAENQLAP
jgi:hypothetical protein